MIADHPDGSLMCMMVRDAPARIASPLSVPCSAIDPLSDGIRQDLQTVMVYSTSKSIRALYWRVFQLYRLTFT